MSLALVYGAGIVLDFVLIGLVVGEPIVAFSQHPVTNGVFALLFIVFGLSLLGLFEIRLPSSVNALAGLARGGQGYLGVFVLGTTFVITSFTCNVPIVGAMLAGGAQAKSFLQILVGMGLFGLTMALPFVALALFPSRVRALPRSGEWMHTLKVTLGFIEIAAALKFISNVDVVLGWKALPRELFCYLVAAIGLTTAVYLFGLIRLQGENGQVSPLRMVFGMLVMILSIYFVHAARVSRLNFVMEAILPPYSSEEAPVAGARPDAGKPPGAGWTIVEDDFQGGLEKAKVEGKLALINWTGIT
jgi:thiol:disulfide interchange protein DsbD